MRTFKTTFAAFAAFSLIGSGAVLADANEASDSADISASIITAIAIASSQDLDFGQVVASVDAGTVVISTAGARSSTGGATLGFQGEHAQALFDVSGQAENTYAISLPGSAVIESGENTMTVNTFTSDPDESGALSVGGAQTLSVGATLQVGANQAPGDYSGDFEVTVTYN